MSDQLRRAYVVLVDALRKPRKKDALEQAVQTAVREVRRAIQELGIDPDESWVNRGALPLVFPDVLYVTKEPDRDDEWFMAHEHGVTGIDNGARVATYRLEATRTVKVTTEVLADEAVKP